MVRLYAGFRLINRSPDTTWKTKLCRNSQLATASPPQRTQFEMSQTITSSGLFRDLEKKPNQNRARRHQ